MFGLKRKEKKETEYHLGVPACGKVIPLSEVNDPTFCECMLGDGAAVIPEAGKFFAPADGEVTVVFDTLHAISMTTDFGAEILIHVGLDTVNMKGEGFTGHVKVGQKVKKGDLLLEIDLEKVKKAGYDTVTPVVICNTSDYAKVEGIIKEHAKPGENMIILYT